MTLTLNRPWSNVGTARRFIVLDICAKLFVNPTRGSKDIERTRKTVIQCLILDCDLDIEPTLVKDRHCISSHHTWHLFKVICKSHQRFKRYRADTKAWRTDRQTEIETETERQIRVGARRSMWLAMWRHLLFVAVINELSVCLTTGNANCFLFSCAVIWRRSSYSRAQHDLVEVPIMISSDEMRNEIPLSRDGQIFNPHRYESVAADLKCSWWELRWSGRW